MAEAREGGRKGRETRNRVDGLEVGLIVCSVPSENPSLDPMSTFSRSG